MKIKIGFLFIFFEVFFAKTQAQHTFQHSYKSWGKVETLVINGIPKVEVKDMKPTNMTIQCTQKEDGMVIRFIEKLPSGELKEGYDWDVNGRPEQYLPGNPNSFLYNVVNYESTEARVIYIKGNSLYILNNKGFGKVYYEETSVEASDILKEAFDVIQSDGKTVYHYNHSAEVTTWTSSLKNGDENRMIFLAPEEGAEYRIIDTFGTRRYIFTETQPYSSLLFREKLGDAVHFSGDTIIITRDYLRDRNDRIPKQFRYMWYYPDNIEMLSYEAECNTCLGENWQNWETGKGMLLFTCNDVARVKLTVKYRLIKPAISNGKTDTIRIVKSVHDTVYRDAQKVSKTVVGRNVVEKESFIIKNRKLTIAVWDNAGVDGDIITLTLNGRVVLSNLRLDKCRTTFTIDLDPGENILVMKAENLGTSPPNTASFLFTSEGFKKSVVLRADMGYSEAVKIISE